MSNGSWNLIYRGYSSEDLLAERDNLRSQLSIFATQSVGSKSFTRDLRELRDRLEACQFVVNERGQLVKHSEVTVDFSQLGMTGSLGPGDYLH